MRHKLIIGGVGAGNASCRSLDDAYQVGRLIAIEGEYGTLSEIAISLKSGKPVIELGSWSSISTTHRAETPAQAVQHAFIASQEGNK